MPDNLTREALYSLFRTDAHGGLDAALERADVHGLAVYEDAEGKRRARPTATTDAPESDGKGGKLLGVFLKPGDRLRRALDHLRDNPGMTPYAVAPLYGVSTQALYVAIKRQKRQALKAARPVCPCCGQPLKTDA